MITGKVKQIGDNFQFFLFVTLNMYECRTGSIRVHVIFQFFLFVTLAYGILLLILAKGGELVMLSVFLVCNINNYTIPLMINGSGQILSVFLVCNLIPWCLGG